MAASTEQDRVTEEAWLVGRVGAGDRAAFRELYSRFSAPLFSLAVRMLGDAHDAEEALQDIFVKIWDNARTYDASLARPFTWSVTIARRTCIDALRKRHRLLPSAPALTATSPSVDETILAPRHAAMLHEDALRVRNALDALPAEQRRAVELALFSGLAQPEIAARLGQPLGTVKSWIRRGLLDLRSALNSV